MGIHRDTIRNYIKLSIQFGFNPQKDNREFVTDDLVLSIKSAIFYSNVKQNKAPRDELLLPVKDKIEGYLRDGLKGSKIMSLLAREGIIVYRDSLHIPLYSDTSSGIIRTVNPAISGHLSGN